MQNPLSLLSYCIFADFKERFTLNGKTFETIELGELNTPYLMLEILNNDD